MRIQKDQMIGDLPALDVRRFMQRRRDWVFARESLNDFFPDISDEKLQKTWAVLLEEGYFEFREERDGRSWYELTPKGNALAQASAAKPISRKTATKRLQEFMSRVEQVNQSAEYVFKVRRVALFGSLLSDAAEVNDIDLAIELEGRESDREGARNQMLKRADLARANGKVFHSVIQQLLWSRHEIYLFLKARSRVFSLHDIEELSNLNPKDYKMLLGHPPTSKPPKQNFSGIRSDE
jgi:predicted nucleotidyltransferase